MIKSSRVLERKKFVIETPSVEGNKVMNIPRVRRHAHIWRSNGHTLICKDCGYTIKEQ